MIDSGARGDNADVWLFLTTSNTLHSVLVAGRPGQFRHGDKIPLREKDTSTGITGEGVQEKPDALVYDTIEKRTTACTHIPPGSAVSPMQQNPYFTHLHKEAAVEPIIHIRLGLSPKNEDEDRYGTNLPRFLAILATLYSAEGLSWFLCWRTDSTQ